MMVFDLLERGGGMMWVLLTISMVALAITLDRLITLFVRSGLNEAAFLRQVLRLVEERKYRQALEACNVKTLHPLPRVLKAGIAKANRRDKEIERAMEEEMLRAMPKLQKGIGFLGLMGNTATLLGLLGTIFGLIQAFSGVSAASASARQEVLAAGISVAMYTTAFGLIVAVPILFAHQLISGRVDNILIRLEEGAVALLGVLSGRLQEVDAATGSNGFEDVA